MERNYEKVREYEKQIPNFDRYGLTLSEGKKLMAEAAGDPYLVMLTAFKYGVAIGYRAGSKK